VLPIPFVSVFQVINHDSPYFLGIAQENSTRNHDRDAKLPPMRGLQRKTAHEHPNPAQTFANLGKVCVRTKHH
jgi:hypothetical protein